MHPEKVPTYLRREDQIALAGLAFVLFLAITFSVSWFAFSANGLVNLDRLPEHEARFLVDVNNADWTELAALPNIGETMARRIVEYRRANGPFESLESLAAVKGIGTQTIQSIQPYIAELSVSDKLVASGN